MEWQPSAPELAHLVWLVSALLSFCLIALATLLR